MQIQPPASKLTHSFPTVSVIVPARNEEANIAACLQSILANEYKGKVEVIVVNDHSTDGTAAIVQQYKNVKLLQLSDYVKDPINSYKKKAIETGIENSGGELIVCTDADCVVPPNWLNKIGETYNATCFCFLAMPVKINTSQNNSLFTIFQSLDLMSYQGLSGAAIQAKKPMLCNGANIAYTRKSFNEVGGFKGIDGLASGDDVLLMHKIHGKFPGSIKFLKDKEVIVSTSSMPTVSSFFSQRVRWASKATQYKNSLVTLVAAIVWLFNVLLLLLPFLLLWKPVQVNLQEFSINGLEVWLICLVLKTFLEVFYLRPVADFFSARTQLIWFIPAQPFHIFYTVIAGFLGLKGGYSWKGRSVK